MDELKHMIEKFLAGESDALEFSLDLEAYLVIHYDEMYAENAAATLVLNDELPEICADYEPGFDPAPFMAAVKREYERALAAAQEHQSP